VAPIICKNLADTLALAQRFIVDKKEGAVVGLSGELGAGKTAFVRGCIEAIAKSCGQPVPTVISPSFVFQQTYDGLSHPVHHFDLYRLDSIDEAALNELGYFDSLEKVSRRKGFLFVEWPERAKPTSILGLTDWIRIEFTGEARIYQLNTSDTGGAVR